MENEQDFVIEDGVLKGYTGPGGDMAIPEAAAETVEDAFSEAAQDPAGGDAAAAEAGASGEAEDVPEAEAEAGEDVVSGDSALAEDAGSDDAVDEEDVPLEAEQDSMDGSGAFAGDDSYGGAEALPDGAEETGGSGSSEAGQDFVIEDGGLPEYNGY